MIRGLPPDGWPATAGHGAGCAAAADAALSPGAAAVTRHVATATATTADAAA